ncbi:BTB/POZ and MATH domain-containing protein 2 [Rhynchospora pubera]|uniref:BTB/POZ and MATH domain-containing protein 2 n=1 Tax=Rhynchospora pubera TaxID=906938 RepID=A0AAV8DSX7_9POAL|nr:BTB/POZ and MATH domain-containing protein 2 [Rhynchospora pubera]
MSISTIDSTDMPETASTLRVEKVMGSHLFKISGYSLQTYNRKGKHLESATFSVGGYDWSILYYPKGKTGTEDDDTSIFIYLKSEAKRVEAQCSFEFLNQDKKMLSKKETTSVYTFTSEEADKQVNGFPKFLKRSAFESVLTDDCLLIRCTVTVFKAFPVKVETVFPLIVPPPIDLQQLSHLLEEAYGADVTFEVNGQIFNAHKCILAMRSEVFRAQLFGPLKEKSGTIIKIEDMDAPVFKCLLHFIYFETIPEFEEINGSEKKHNLAQHLLVAADRYDLDRLKILCENILYDSIDRSNVVALLFLAERHNCVQLKAACLKLLGSPEILAEVVAKEQFQSFVQNSVLNIKPADEAVKLPIQRFKWLDQLINWRRERAQGSAIGRQFTKLVRPSGGPRRYLTQCFKVTT